jgi:integrase
MDFLIPEEVAHLFAATDEEDKKPAILPGWYVPIKLAIFSGLRQGEQLALRIGDLDFHNGQVHVRQTLAWDWEKRDEKAKEEQKERTAPRYRFASPKSKTSVRNVDLPPDLLEDLRRYVAGQPDQDPDRLYLRRAPGRRRSSSRASCSTRPRARRTNARPRGQPRAPLQPFCNPNLREHPGKRLKTG